MSDIADKLHELADSEARARLEAARSAYPDADGDQLICYRSKQNVRAHYVIASYQLEPSGVVSAILVHGADSFLPGVGTFGQPLEQLVPCRCGAWREASAAQTDDALARAARVARGRHNAS